MNMESINAQWGEAGLELSMDELALVNGGSFWSVIKDVGSAIYHGGEWVVNHADDIGKAVSTGETILNTGKNVLDFLGKIF
jgi:hypothetical protein